MQWHRHQVLGYAPEGPDFQALVIACSRAGGLGVLGMTRTNLRIEFLKGIERFGVRSYAIRTGADQLSGDWLTVTGPSMELVIGVGPWLEGHGAEAAERVHASGRRLVCEVLSLDEAIAALGAGADGLIVVGNEAGGRVGTDSSFILLQAVLARTDRPVWVRGGIGPRVAAGCMAAGAAGVVLDGALLLARESPLSEEVRRQLGSWDGSEPSLIEPQGGPALRVFAPRMSPVLARLKEAAREGAEAWSRAVDEEVGWGPGQAWPAGQDAALAADLADRYVTAAGIVRAVERAIAAGLEGAAQVRPLAEDAPLAKSHGSRYPILQGPMTRVSDVAPFAAAVAREGGTPFVALALLARPAVEDLLAETARQVGGLPWGVGLLGFAPPELLLEHLAAVRAAHPPFALIAGGRPDQAAELEREGIATYFHAPSPGLLDQYLRAGTRRFVLEGRECGGHVGPRSSFVLWEQACGILERAIDAGIAAETLSVVFAGGIHDARSAAAVAALAGDLAARGMKIGILMGTAYLFTHEAVFTGAIVSRFQDEALRCRGTVLLETGPGHLVRVSPTPFADRFAAERQRLLVLGKPHEEIRETLERLNAGRLRIAAKGVDRSRGANSLLVAVPDEEQATNGLYMLGQVATLREGVVSVGELHEDVTSGATRCIERHAPFAVGEPTPAPNPAAIAVVGMACVFPGARNVETFWANSLRGLDNITEVPPDRWDWRLYYDPDPKAPDKISSKWGGFLPDVPFDPLRYGMPPTSLPSIEPAQLLALEVTRSALADAGYARRPFPRERTAVVLGMGGGAAQVAMGYAFRSYLPMLDTVTPGGGTAALEGCRGLLPEWTEDSFPGFLLNVTAGRIANRLDLGGANYAVDAACGSSLAALNLAVRELATGAADMVVLGGVDTVQNPFTYLAFSKTQAFSPRGRCRPFDAGADGIVISEGVAAVILKRLADAERDGDRIYAVIQGVGASSDGRCRGLTAPSFEGQVRALERAYAQAGIDPATVGYVEAHGTGTAVGDVVEIEALTRLFRRSRARPGSCVVGSVKSQIGHTKCAAGLAGLIHASLALHHRVLPPTIGIATPNTQLDLRDGPFRLNVEARPWLHRIGEDHLRRAGVSAFGFGGTNFHAVLEAYGGDPVARRDPVVRDWPAELLVWSASDREGLLRDLDHLSGRLAEGARFPLKDLAHGLAVRSGAGPTGPTLAIVATSHEDLAARLESARAALWEGRTELTDARGLFYAERPPFADQPVAFLFPGQGSQSVGMLGDLAVLFDEVRGAFELFDSALAARGGEPIGPLVFPPPAFDEETRRNQSDALRATEVAQPAIGAASLGMARLLAKLGMEPDMVAGHSYGELLALHAAGAMDAVGLAELSEGRGRLLHDAAGDHPGAMAALSAGPEVAAGLIGDEPEVRVVNLNGPRQTVIAGPREAVAAGLDRARTGNIGGRLLPVACAFHTPIMRSACEPLARLAAERLTSAPDRPVFSNLDAAVHPSDPREIARRLGVHVTHPVRFAEMVEAMHERGARVFVEVGPGNVLTTLVGSILGERPHLAVSTDATGRPGLASLLHALARLVVAGVGMRLEPLTRGRSLTPLDPKALPSGDGSPPLAPSTWMVNGSRSRPLAALEPRRLGQAFAPPPPKIGNGRHTPDIPVRTIMKEPTPTAPAHPANGRLLHAPASSPSPIPQAERPGGASERVLAAFQETMQTFLDVQRATMLAYVSGRRPSARASHAEPPASMPTATNGLVPAAPVPVQNGPPPAAVVGRAAETPIAVASPPAPQAPTTRATIEAKLLEIVRDRTGYPPEVLKLELDVEADLGIDSIKRVEILGKLRDAFPQLGESFPESVDSLTRAMTLGAIVDRVEKLIDRPTATPPTAPDRAANSTPPSGKSHGEVRRSLLQVVEVPLDDRHVGLIPGGTVLLTRDDGGVAAALASGLRSQGIQVLTMGGADSGLDWTSPAAIEEAVRRARGEGPLSGLIDLVSLRAGSLRLTDLAAWSDRTTSGVRSLFLLAKAMADDFERAADAGGSCLIAATAMGGGLGTAGPASADFFPGNGGVAGLVKTLAREWTEVRARVVDLDPREDATRLADHLLAEALLDDAWPEVGYLDGRRIRLQPVAALLGDAGAPIALAAGEPVLISGGARGITAHVAAALARRWRPTLLLIGTTPPPPADDDDAIRGLTGAAELKSAFYEQFRCSGRPVMPTDLEEAYGALRRAREIRGNLERLRALGSRVEYAQVDVRDSAGLERVMADWRRRFGEPVGMIHGAGLIRDKLIRDKSVEAFDRVLGTKLDGALNLVRLIRPDLLRFAVFFSSVAGRFGNPGQSDYAAANEALNKLALWLDRRWPGRVVAPIWGPWSGVGMVSDLEVHLGARGLGMIAPEAGAAALMDELVRGRKGDVEVLLANTLGGLDGPLGRARPQAEAVQ